MMAASLLFTGEIAKGRRHFDQAIALYDPVAHRPLAQRFGQDARVAILTWRSLALWLLGYPESALADAEQALTVARAMGHAPSTLLALSNTPYVYNLCGNYATAMARLDELVALADEKGALFWKTRCSDRTRMVFGTHRQNLRSRRNDYFWYR